MTKFDRPGKTRLSGFLFQNIRFWLVQKRIKTRAKLRDLKIQGILRHEKEQVVSRSQSGRNTSQSSKAAKTGPSSF
jgi:hypothetical protein